MRSTTAPPPGLRRPALRTITNPVTHEVATFRRYMAETGHRFSEIDVTVRAGGGVPLHYHAARTETFTAVSSALHLQAPAGGAGGGAPGRHETLVLAPGETAAVAPGQAHRFWNPGPEDVTFTVRVGAPAAGFDGEGFEKGLYIWYGLARDGLVGEDGIASNPLHVAVIMYMQDTWVAGWGFWLLTPVFAALYAVARWTGVEGELVRKYWTLADGQDSGEGDLTPLLGGE